MKASSYGERRETRFCSALLLVALLLSLSGCSLFRANSLSDFEQKTQPKELCRQQIYSSIRREQARLKTFSAVSHFSIKGAKQLQSLRQNIVFSSEPQMQALRFEFFVSELNRLFALLRAHDGILRLLLPDKGIEYFGEDKAASAYTLIRMPLISDEMGFWLATVSGVSRANTQLAIVEQDGESLLAAQQNARDGRVLFYLLENSTRRKKDKSFVCSGVFRIRSLEVFPPGEDQSNFYSEFTYLPNKRGHTISFVLRDEGVEGSLKLSEISKGKPMSEGRYQRLFLKRAPSSYLTGPFESSLFELLE